MPKTVEVECVICHQPLVTPFRGKQTAKVHKGACLAALRSKNATAVNKRLHGTNNPSAH